MFVRVVDGDGTDRLLVDHIRMNVALSPGTTTPFTVFTGLTINVNLTARFSLTCDPDYYGLDCNIYCSPQDSDELGHYTCAANGNKECLPGYREPASDCKECAPRSGCCKLIWGWRKCDYQGGDCAKCKFAVLCDGYVVILP